MEDEVVVEPRCEHGKELYSVHAEKKGDLWWLLGMFQCRLCQPNRVLMVLDECPAEVALRGRHERMIVHAP